jgi:hypothetical protein
MKKFASLVVAGAALIATPANAQNSTLAAKPAIMETISATDVSSMLSEFGITSEVKATPGGATPTLIATTSGGAKFLVGFFDCADNAKPAGCKQVMVSTAQASSGVEFDDLNTFNGQSSVTTVVYEATNQILIFGRNVFAPGGIGRENFKLQVALFLGDMQRFVSERRESTKSVSLLKTPSMKSKITSITSDAVSPEARKLMISSDGSTEVEIAISNSLDVNFVVAK